jgi:hypothetical protein
MYTYALTRFSQKVIHMHHTYIHTYALPRFLQKGYTCIIHTYIHTYAYFCRKENYIYQDDIMYTCLLMRLYIYMHTCANVCTSIFLINHSLAREAMLYLFVISVCIHTSSCMHACMYVQKFDVLIHGMHYTCDHGMYHTYIHAYIHTYIDLHMCTSARASGSALLLLHAPYESMCTTCIISSCVCVCVYVCMNACMYICVYVYASVLCIFVCLRT